MRNKQQEKSNDTMPSEADDDEAQRLQQRDRVGTDFTAEASDTAASLQVASYSSNNRSISTRPSGDTSTNSEIATSSEGAYVRDMTIPEGSESKDSTSAVDCGDVVNNEGIPSD